MCVHLPQLPEAHGISPVRADNLHSPPGIKRFKKIPNFKASIILVMCRVPIEHPALNKGTCLILQDKMEFISFLHGFWWHNHVVIQ